MELQNKVKYSIIIPVYNMERYLRECIDSLTCQQREDIEIILINDGSKDSSLSICKEYKEKYNYVKVIDKENSGSMDSWIKGVELSVGEYIGFVDSDDFVSNNYFEILDNYTNQNYDMVMFDFNRVYKERVSYKSVNKIGYGDISDNLVKVKNDYYKLHEQCSLYRWDKIIKSNIIKKSIEKITYRGIYFEDQVTLTNLFEIKSAIYIQDRLYNYRMRKNSVSHGFNYRVFEDNINMEKQMTEIAKQFGYKTTELYNLHLHFIYLYIKNAMISPTPPKRIKVSFKDVLKIQSKNKKITLLLYKLRWIKMYKSLVKNKHKRENLDLSEYFD